jgi:membrane protease YdiL (CAAX protease family)
VSLKKYIQSHPVTSYFFTTFGISWLGAFILVAPKLLQHQPIEKMDGLLLFPIMLIGPPAASIIFTASIHGKEGLRSLLSKVVKWKVPVKWFLLALLLPPCLMMLVLLFLENSISDAFAPNFFPLGFLFALPAAFLEEVGWTGFALSNLLIEKKSRYAGVIVGGLWGLWHLPVIDFLGSASPHGKYLLVFFLSFVVLLTAMRILMARVYVRTQSIFIVQLMHLVFTGSLVMIGPSNTSPAQETLWYAVYAGVLALFAAATLSFSVRAD